MNKDDNQKDKDIRELMSSIKTSIEKAPALNDGFDRLVNKIGEIQIQQKEMQAQQNRLEKTIDEVAEQVDHISDSIYEPDKGLYARIKIIDYKVHGQNEALNDFSEDIGKSYRSIKENSEKVDKIEDRVDTLEKENSVLLGITGKDHEDLRTTIKHGKSFTKIAWAFVLAIVGMAGKFAYEYFINR